MEFCNIDKMTEVVVELNTISAHDDNRRATKRERQPGESIVGNFMKTQDLRETSKMFKLNQSISRCPRKRHLNRVKQSNYLVSILTIVMIIRVDAQTGNPTDARLEPESRAEHLRPQSQNNAFDQFVNLLNAYAANNNNNRGSPNLANAQRGSQQPAQLPAVSTPVNSLPQFTHNQRPPQIQLPQQQPPSQRLNQPASSSPPTPYLTLNRIASMANPQQSSNRPQINLQPLNTIPLGSFGANNNQRVPVGTMMPPRGMQPIRLPSQFAQTQPPPVIRPPQPPASSNVQSPATNQLRPMAGFVPSVAPPAMQSPPSPNGVARVTSPAPNDERSESNPVQTTSTPATTTTMGSTTTISEQTTSSAGSTSTTSGSLVDKSTESTDSAGKELVWSPVENRTTNAQQATSSRTTLAPSPDIVTVPPGYNPDSPSSQPERYDIAVSAQMGPSSSGESKPVIAMVKPSPVASPTATASPDSSSSAVSDMPTIAPTAVTTIIWSPPASDSATSSIQPTRVATESVRPTQVTTPAPTRIRDNSLGDESMVQNDSTGVVYGKPKDSKPQPPAESAKAIIKPAQLDTQVRPYSAGTQSQSSVLKSSHHQHPFRPSKPLSGANQSPLNVNSGFTITANGNQTMPTGDIQDYVAGQPPPIVGAGSQQQTSFQVGGDPQEPTISAFGGQDPAGFEVGNPAAPVGSANGTEPGGQVTPAPAPTRVRRPTFKPKPAVPPIRIDSCIVGDDSSCDQSHNERCVTEYGISSCHCKPGYARLSQLRGFCNPVSSLQLSMKIDRLSDERRLVFNHTLENPNSEEYQYMEFETVQALAGAFQATQLAKQFMGARVNKFFERKGKVWANVSVNFEANNVTRSERIQQLAGQELARVVGRKSLGDSTIVLDGSKESVSRLTDVNECASGELNDCSAHASCTNLYGGFQCQCLSGYEDKHQAEDRSKQGRVCQGCSASYCSNRGECSIFEGQKRCKCRSNFIGARCDIDSEVLAVAIGGSLVGIAILVVTFWCLFVFNRRWKREQQKMDAMSATSGLTFNYVNSSGNSLISPTRVINGLHRSAGHPINMAANYSQRFGAALVGGARGGVVAGQQYAPDQQAIMGSTSSGSSAASQPIACNPYAAGYQYEDAGLLIAPASTGSSEQTSPSGNSYRAAGNGYTLSGHHHHNHHHHMAHLQMGPAKQPLSQFHAGAAAADYRTLNPLHCPTMAYEAAPRWRTLHHEHEVKQSQLTGYYLSPDMLVGQQQQQLYASPQRELCIDTGGHNQGRSRRQPGRSSNQPTLRPRSQGPRTTRNGMYNDYDR